MAGAAHDLLTQSEAEARAARISDISYELVLQLTRGAESYRGEVTIRFQLTGSGDTFLDFRGGTIELLEIDGITTEPVWTGYRLVLPAAVATQGEHIVRVRYESTYDHTGDGFHQFVDPEDGEEYLYTNFEPYAAHRLLPCFDQPDLKGRFELTVSAPAAWKLIANGVPEVESSESRSEANGGQRLWRFTRTPPISTYLFALIAGPYYSIESEHEGLPLGLYCRRSLVRHFDGAEVLEITRQGLNFFSEFFDYPYPFGKYDQVFVPEFNAGAMENVAAVTHSERLIFRDPPTENQRLTRAEVILHEMAHMWFGNLVTMRWWNDLWLNESFATYMAYLALTEATRFDKAWQSFNAGMKAWAYRQDQLITTHPIAGEVASTEETFLNFDGITYGKGAAVIKQLVAAMGLEGFRTGMRLYFQRHAFSNTTLHQFLNALQDGIHEVGSERDLHAWAALWLETPSLNTISAHWERATGTIKRLSLTQSVTEMHPTLRPHYLELGLWHEVEKSDGLTMETLSAEIDSAEAEVDAAAGRRAPLFVLPNYGDHAYTKIALDDVSLTFARERLPEITDPLSRQLSWRALWDMVRDQQLSSLDYLEIVSRHLSVEHDVELVETLLATAQGAIARYVPNEQKSAASHAFFKRAWNLLPGLPVGDLQILWARTLIQNALSPEDIKHTGLLADGELEVSGLAIDQEMRWEIAARYAAYGLEGAEDRAAAESVRDPSDRGQRALLRIETSTPDLTVKAVAWERLLGEGYGSLHLTIAAMSGFHWPAQSELLAPYVERFFETLPGIARDRDHEFTQAFFGQLFPGYRVEHKLLERSRLLLSEVETEPLLARLLREANDDLERAIRCREFAQTQS